MKSLVTIWDFVAGGSRVTPVATAAAVAVAVVLVRNHADPTLTACAYAGVIAAGLAGAAFEQP